MILQKDQFPITIQAYEITGNTELFIAEQIVNSQGEIDTFSRKYAGKLIKAKGAATVGASTIGTNRNTKKSSAATIIIVILIILLILAAIGYYTGWLQRTTGLDL